MISAKISHALVRAPRSRALAAALALAVPSGACASHAPAPGASSQLEVDQTEIVSGVDDSGRDPAVVALDIGTDSLCTGTLIAPDVVLTARHCVSVTPETIVCPALGKQVSAERPVASLRVLAGDTLATAHEVARGAAVLTPPGNTICDADIALLILDRPVDIDPIDVSASPVAMGDHVTAVGYGRRADGDPPGTKLFREHVEVLSASSTEFFVGEATCQGDSGGPALDETTGEIVGVVSRGGATCDGPGAHNVYTRTDAFQSLIAEALAMSVYQLEASDGGPKKSKKGDGGTTKPPSDMGNECATAAGCGSGVCVTEPSVGMDATARRYCSRDCGTGDRCPSHYHCTATGQSQKVCIQTT